VTNEREELNKTSDKLTQVPDPRDQHFSVPITRYELDLILEHHRQELLSYAVEAIAFRQTSGSGMRRASHAIERLRALDAKALEKVEAEIEAKTPEWLACASHETEREERGIEARGEGYLGKPGSDGLVEWENV